MNILIMNKYLCLA